MTYVKKITHDGHTLTVERESVDVTAISEPDPAWTYTDMAGHEHRAVSEDAPHVDRVTYPTLLRKYGDETWCWECQDTHRDEWLECADCGERITPGTRAGRPRSILGMITYTIDDEPVSEQAAQDFIATARREREARS
jgi:hypothetical protein